MLLLLVCTLASCLAQYDKEANRVGMGHADCTSIRAAGSQAGGAAPTSTAASSKQHPVLQPPPPATAALKEAAADLFSSNDVVPLLAPGESSLSRPRQSAAASPRLVWLGVSVGVVLVLAFLQLGYVAFCQRQEQQHWGGKGSSSGGSPGAAAPRRGASSLRLLGRQQGGSYQTVAPEDAQELVDLSERAVTR